MPEFNLTQEQYDELIKQIRILKFQQQEANDLLEGGLTSRNLSSLRTTYIINAQDSLDDSYPMYVHFNIISEMIKIVSVKVSFWILNYRAYSKAGKVVGDLAYINTQIYNTGGVDYVTLNTGDVSAYKLFTVSGVWNLKEHIHPADYGIFEEETSPTIKFYVSENEGVSYNDTFFGGYTTKKADLEITSLLSGAGSKLIKFESTTRARLSVQIEIKLDIRART